MLTQKGSQGYFKKDVLIYGRPANGVHPVLTADDADHTRMRRILAYAFSEKALKMQEPLVQSYIDSLIAQLDNQVDSMAQGKVNMENWYRWTTFDVMGDLSFGQPTDCLKGSQNRHWSSMIFDLSKALVFMSAARRYPWVEKPLRRLILPKRLMQRTINNAKLVSEMVDSRLKIGSDKQDFMSYIMKYNDEKGMNLAEIKANASLFMTAGTDSSATILTGATYYILKDPKVLKRLTDEIRDAFKTEADISFQNVAKLPYLSAVLDESTRMYPPTLAGQPHRVPPEGATISGYRVPGGVSRAVTPIFSPRSLPLNNH